VCHNDLAPVTTIYFDHRPIAFIDWDFAAPAPSLWDVARAAWSFVPLSSDEFCRRYGYSTDARGPRLRAFCDAYGLDERDRGRLLDTVRARQESIFETVRRGAEAGDRQCAAAWAPSGGLRLVSFTNEPGSMLQVLRDRGRSRGA
jgi:aminoglycoside phosphotransferase (APT) family kinase protein